MRPLFALMLALSTPPVAAAPNILLVIADDMGINASPCHDADPATVRMPNLGALCDSGMVFDAAYAAPICSPTRATLMTGRYGTRTGVGGVLNRRNPARLNPDEVTLFDQLQAVDYATALVGKWHLTSDQRDLDHPAALGVTEHFGPFSGGVDDYENWTAIHNGRPEQVTTYATTALTDHAIDWVDAQDGPWFLWLAHVAPHTPFHLPPPDLHSRGDLPADQNSIARNPARYYGAALEALDGELGRLLDAMDPGTRANTVVIFIGDNGTPTRVLGRTHRGRAKGSLYEGGVHVPLVVAGPGVQSGRSDALVNSTDLYATILNLAGVASAAEDSESLIPALRGQDGTRTYAYVEHFSDSVPRGAARLGWAIRDDRYKLIHFEGAALQLFDLRDDPDERQDLLIKGTETASDIVIRLVAAREDLLR